MTSAVLQPGTSTTPATSGRENSYSKKIRKLASEECLEEDKAKNKPINNNSTEKTNVLIEGNKIFSDDKSIKQKVVLPINRIDKVIEENNKICGENKVKEIGVSNKNQTKICRKNIKRKKKTKVGSLPIQIKNKVSDKNIEKEVTLPIVGDKNRKERLIAPLVDKNNTSDQNAKVILVTVPVVTSTMQNTKRACACGVCNNCLNYQLRILKEENEDLKSKIQIHVKTERDLKHANNLAKIHVRELESQFESKVKIAFQHFLSPTQVEAVLKKKLVVKWNEEDISKAFNIMQFSKQFYKYLKDNLNYPLPGLSTIKRWVHQTSLKLEKECSPEMCSDNPISTNIPSDYPMQLENLSFPQPMAFETVPNAPSEILSDHTIGSINTNPVKEGCNESASSAGIQIKTLYFPSSRNDVSEMITNKKKPTVAKKSFQFHLSHKNYFNKLILKRYRRKAAIKPKRFACSICQKGFDLNGALKRHFKTHVFDNPWTCDVCDEIFSSKYHLDKHITTHKTTDKFVCDICDQSFVKKVNFQDHYLNHKNIQTQDLYNTDPCTIEGTSNEQYGADQFLITNYCTQTQVKPYMCHICNELFENKSDLKTHLVVCKTESKNCPNRPKRFRMKVEPSFFCEWCNKGFRYRQFLEKHILKHKNGKMVKRVKPRYKYKPKPGQIFECEICDKKFANAQSKYRHKVLHDDNRNKVQFFCSVCNKGFTQKRYLSKHSQTHCEMKPYACVLCPKRFTQNTTLKKHYEKTHQNESYSNVIDFYV